MRLIVFDWDNCLYPTTYLIEHHGLATTWTLSDQHKSFFEVVETQLIDAIKTAQTLGDVVIITNSEDGWVKRSCLISFPKLWTHIQHLPIYSARSKHMSMEQKIQVDYFDVRIGEDWMTQWKSMAFRNCLSSDHRHVVSFGDTESDRSAALSLQDTVKVSHVTTVSQPDMSRHVAQWRVITAYMKKLCELSPCDLKVSITADLNNK